MVQCSKAQVNLAKYPPETAKILHRDIFWFFLWDVEFVSRTISDGSVDLDKFPASRMRQLAKKLKSSKATAHHIKLVAGDPQAVQINLLRYQFTELPAGKYKEKRPPVKPNNQTTSNRAVRIIRYKPNTRRGLTPRAHITIRTDVSNVEI